MPDASDYAKYPEHTLYGVPQEVLDAGRKATQAAADCHDMDAGMVDPIADSVVAEILDAGYRIVRRSDLEALLRAAWSDVIPSASEVGAAERIRKALR